MKIAILGSGKGTNTKSILEEFRKGNLGNVKQIQLFSDKSNSEFLGLGNKYDCKTEFVEADAGTARIRGKFETQWIRKLKKFNPQLVVLAGFMKILSKDFINVFDGKIINLHPSLLPSFKGLNAIEKAFNHGVRVTGCTVHWVDDSVDCGKIISQMPVRIFEDDDLMTVSERVHAAEHYLLPKVIKDLSKNML